MGIVYIKHDFAIFPTDDDGVAGFKLAADDEFGEGAAELGTDGADDDACSVTGIETYFGNVAFALLVDDQLDVLLLQLLAKAGGTEDSLQDQDPPHSPGPDQKHLHRGIPGFPDHGEARDLATYKRRGLRSLRSL